MATLYAINNGRFHDAGIWSTNPAGPANASVPTVGDVAVANGYILDIDLDVTCLELRNDGITGATEGGYFNCTASVEITSDIIGLTPSDVTTTFSPEIEATLYCGGNFDYVINGSVYGGKTSPATDVTRNGIYHFGLSNLTINGNLILGGQDGPGYKKAYGLHSDSTGTVTINVDHFVSGATAYGACASINITNASNTIINAKHVYAAFTTHSDCYTITHSSTGPIIINAGDKLPSDNSDITNPSGTRGAIRIQNSLNAIINTKEIKHSNSSAKTPVVLSSANNLTIDCQTIEGGQTTLPAIKCAQTTINSNTILGGTAGVGIEVTSGLLTVNCPEILYNGSGTAPIYSRRISYDNLNTVDNGFIRYSSADGVIPYFYQFTSYSLSAFNMPPPSAVQVGFIYGEGLVGECVLPPISAVKAGVPVGNDYGIAILDPEQLSVTVNDIWNTSANSATVGSIGEALQKAVSTEAAGKIIQSFGL